MPWTLRPWRTCRSRFTSAAAPSTWSSLAFGYLGDERTAQRDADELAHILNVNFTSAAIVLAHLANYLEERGHADWDHCHFVRGRRPGPSEQLCLWVS